MHWQLWTFRHTIYAFVFELYVLQHLHMLFHLGHVTNFVGSKCTLNCMSQPCNCKGSCCPIWDMQQIRWKYND